MRVLILLSLLTLSFTQLPEAAPADFIEGFFNGLHLGRIAPNVEKCLSSSTVFIDGIIKFVHACKEHRGFYYLGNNFTYALKSVPGICRGCVDAPDDAWEKIQEIYMKPFNHSWLLYFRAVLLNIPYRLDEFVIHYRDIKKAFDEKKYYSAGFNIGELPNIIFNVTSPDPIPDPIDRPRLLEEAPSFDWDAFHSNFRKYFNHTMTAIRGFKWINETTFLNLNESISHIELQIYKGIKELSKPNPNTKEGVFLLIDIVGYLNGLFNGAYFTIEQVSKTILRDTIFGHISHAWMNLVQHVGYFIYHGIKLHKAINSKNYFDITKRITIIIRRVLYFDPDVLDDILNNPMFNMK
jgi:hypothetical protein